MGILGTAVTGAGGGAYTVSNSVRLRASATAYLSRTPASAGNLTTWTWSAWVKRGNLGNLTKLFSAGTPSGVFFFFEITTNNTFKFGNFNGSVVNYSIETTQVFRDPSAWYHVVAVFDTTQATASNRMKMYINGSQVTALTATYPAQNTTSSMNGVFLHQIGNGVYNSTEPFDGYMTEINFIDGQALTPSSFGATNASTGVWQPKAYIGTYGTNGFYLPMQAKEGYPIDYLIVGGGGGGGSPSGGGGGGGGAGGLVYATSQIIFSNSIYSVTVGNGGTGGSSSNGGTQGGSSSFNSVTAVGGGYGGGYLSTSNGYGGSGGSGGGAAGNRPSSQGGSGTSGQGNSGGNASEIPNGTGGGGGGGANASGSSASTSAGANGGNGTANSITGSSVTYAGGGGGGADIRSSTTVGTGGSGGGGNGGGSSAAVAGTANTGGGGGGGQTNGSGTGQAGANGGSGVVILRMLTSDYTGTTTGSPTVTTDGSYTVVKFTSSGSYTA